MSVPTIGVDEDLNGAVVSVLVSQGDDNTGCGAGQRVGISPDSMRGALHTYGEKPLKHLE